MNRLRRKVRVDRWLVVPAKFGGERRVPDEIGGEVRAVAIVAVRVDAADAGERPADENRNEQQDEQKGRRVTPRPRGQCDERRAAPTEA